MEKGGTKLCSRSDRLDIHTWSDHVGVHYGLRCICRMPSRPNLCTTLFPGMFPPDTRCSQKLNLPRRREKLDGVGLGHRFTCQNEAREPVREVAGPDETRLLLLVSGWCSTT